MNLREGSIKMKDRSIHSTYQQRKVILDHLCNHQKEKLPVISSNL